MYKIIWDFVWYSYVYRQKKISTTDHSYHYNNENMHNIMKTVREDGTSVRDNDLKCLVNVYLLEDVQ